MLLHFILKIPGIIIATTLHEFTKAAVALYLGNTSPRNEGRLTLNPFKHFEPIGFIIMLQTSFGWGQPVDTDSGYYRATKNYNLIIYSSAIAANIVFAFIVCQIYRYTDVANLNNIAKVIIENIIWLNVSLAVFNLIPVYPLSGSKIFYSFSNSASYFKMLQNEKILQLILVLLLFMGAIGSFLNPLILYIIKIFGVNLTLALF